MADLLSKEKEDNFYQPPVKVIPLLFFEIGFAFLMSFGFRQLISNTSLSAGGLFWFLIGLGLFTVFSFLTALLVNGFQWSGLAAGLSVLASLAVFYDYFSTTLIIFGILVFLILIWGISRLRSELTDSLKIRFFRLTQVFLPKIALGVAILLSLFSYLLFSSQASSAGPGQGGFPISFKNFHFLLKPNEKLVGIFIPDFSFQKPFQIILAGLLKRQLAAKVPSFESLSASAKETMVESVIDEELAGLKKFLGAEINARDSVDKVIYDSLVKKFSQLDERVKKWIIIGIFFVLFLTIRALFIPVNWLLAIFLFLIYLFLLALNFASVKMEPRSKEIIII